MVGGGLEESDLRALAEQPASAGRSTSQGEALGPPGFRVHLDGIALPDMIQICCNTMRQLTVELHAEQRIGHLYFGDGLLLHAEYAGEEGLAAVMRMLQLPEGVASTVQQSRAGPVTIGMRADALLLTVAHRIDESHRPGPPEGPAGEPHRPELTTKVVPRVDRGDEDESPATARSGQRAEELALGGADLGQLQIAQISRNGSFHRCRGATPEFVDATFFAQVAADRLGKLLKLGQCRALGYCGEEESLAVFRGQSIVGVRGRTEPVSLILRKLGLS